MKTFNVLSLGAGIQSSTLLLMSCRGILPKLDGAIFADTGWEKKETYKHLEWLKYQADSAGIPLHIVSMGNMREDITESKRIAENKTIKAWGVMPMYMINKSGKEAMIRRSCTRDYKLRPINNCLRHTILGLKPRAKVPGGIRVHSWIGISSDEALRMRDSDQIWKINTYPLVGIPVEYFDKRLTRTDCIKWLAKNYEGLKVPRSCCVGCPYHTDSEWRQIKKDFPDEFGIAVEMETLIREGDQKVFPRGEVFLHRQCKPLDQVDFRTAEDKGQSNWLNECEGLCGV